MTGTDWMKQLITRLLNISHAQWMYRNFSLHNKTSGYLRQSDQADVLAEIATLSNKRPEEIPEESWFLLEVEMVNLDSSSLAQQKYWIAAMKVALSAGCRCSNPHRRSWDYNNVQTQPTLQQCRNKHLFQRWIKQLLRQMQEDLDLSYGAWRTKRPLNDGLTNGSNKRLRKPD